MNRPLSTYLDVIRFGAACLVMLSHLGGKSWTGGAGWQFTSFGALAVTVFFVLSGFIIAFATDKKEKTAKTYFFARAVRLYSVVIPVLLLTLIIGFIGVELRPDADWGNQTILAYLSSLVFVNQIWFLDFEPGNNGPFWSLCYEVWYYVAFGALLFAPPRYRWYLAIAAIVFAGPKIAAMLLVWPSVRWPIVSSGVRSSDRPWRLRSGRGAWRHWLSSSCSATG